MTKSVMGIDLGGMQIAAALFPARGEPTHRAGAGAIGWLERPLQSQGPASSSGPT